MQCDKHLAMSLGHSLHCTAESVEYLLLPSAPPSLPCSLGEKYKREGNEAYKAGDYLRAKDLYSSAIKHDPQNATYYGNRSATYMMLSDYSAALEDSTRSIHLDESYTKVGVVMLYSALFPSCGLGDSMLIFPTQRVDSLTLSGLLHLSPPFLPLFLLPPLPSPSPPRATCVQPNVISC